MRRRTNPAVVPCDHWGLIEARQVVVPQRRVLRRCQALSDEVAAVDHTRRLAAVISSEGEQIQLRYDVLVPAPGSVSRALPVPGLVEVGIGFKTAVEHKVRVLMGWTLALLLRREVVSLAQLQHPCQEWESAVRPGFAGR